MKPLLVGESPSRSGDKYHAFPLSGAVAQTMCQMAGIPPEPDGTRYGKWTWALYEHFDTINAIERFPRHGFLIAEAAARLREEIESEREVVVLLGRKVQHAYADMTAPAESLVEYVPFFHWIVDQNSPTARRQVVVMPHPSALNRMYNFPAERRKAGKVLNEAIAKAKLLHESRL